MATQKSADWEFYADDGVIIGEFPEATELTGPESDKMVAAFTDLLERSDTDSHVTILRSSEPYSKEGQENLRQSALASVDHGVTRWAVVADGTKKLTMKTTVDVEGLTVEAFDLEETDAAIEWARN
ncbi:STAS/SEC14 domain-containing protein [Halorhabdus rudnickae]|uniref:STAS/SEC14 domain-containing protein n=1 Tax=Halorhabdus rudnickae TaxID=1775544 RepID=UPI0010826FFF|nr:STAS/SEC14 domain-containing protein [Halorhabdus rudnickae]